MDSDGRGQRAVRRNVRAAPFGFRLVARYLARRERRALDLLRGLSGVPQILHADKQGLTRTYLRGRPLNLEEELDLAWFVSARVLLQRIHDAGVAHNDTHKEANWMVDDEGGAVLLDYQLASTFKKRTRWFRLLALEDIRHLLKHKKRFLRSELTPYEWSLLRRKSWAARWWSRTLKPVYRKFTRAIGWRDNEGRGTLPLDTP